MSISIQIIEKHNIQSLVPEREPEHESKSEAITMDDVRVYYGTSGRYLEITPVVNEHFFSTETGMIAIPSRDVNREILFSNFISLGIKHILVIHDSIIWTFPHNIQVLYSVKSRTALSKLITQRNDPTLIQTIESSTYARLHAPLVPHEIINELKTNLKQATKESANEYNVRYKPDITWLQTPLLDMMPIPVLSIEDRTPKASLSDLKDVHKLIVSSLDRETEYSYLHNKTSRSISPIPLTIGSRYFNQNRTKRRERPIVKPEAKTISVTETETETETETQPSTRDVIIPDYQSVVGSSSSSLRLLPTLHLSPPAPKNKSEYVVPSVPSIDGARIYYGLEGRYLEITQVVNDHFYSTESGMIAIPSRDVNREILFSNFISLGIKHILVIHDSVVWTFPHNIQVLYSVKSRTALSKLIKQSDDPDLAQKIQSNTYALLHAPLVPEDTINHLKTNLKEATKDSANEYNVLFKPSVTWVRTPLLDMMPVPVIPVEARIPKVTLAELNDQRKMVTHSATSKTDTEPTVAYIMNKGSVALPVIPLTVDSRHIHKQIIQQSEEHARSIGISTGFEPVIVTNAGDYSGASLYNVIKTTREPVTLVTSSHAIGRTISEREHTVLPITPHSIVHSKLLARYPSTTTTSVFTQQTYNEIWRVIRTSLVLKYGQFNMTPDNNQYLLETIKPTNNVIYMAQDQYGIEALTIASILNDDHKLAVFCPTGWYKFIDMNRAQNGYRFAVNSLDIESISNMGETAYLDVIISQLQPIINGLYRGRNTLIIECAGSSIGILTSKLQDELLGTIERVIIKMVRYNPIIESEICGILATKGFTLTKTKETYQIWRKMG